MRVATRYAVLVAGDILAIALVRELVLSGIFSGTLFGSVLKASPLAGDFRAFVQLVIATLIPLVITGSHSRHRALNNPIRILAAACVASLPQVIPLSISGQMSVALQTMVFVSLSLWVGLLVVRQLSERILRFVFPGQRGAGAAIVVGGFDHFSRALERAVAAPGGDFHVIGYVVDGRSAENGALGTFDDLPTLVDRYSVEAVVVTSDISADRAKVLVEDCLQLGCQILFPARALNVPDLRPTLVWHHDQPFFEFGCPVLKTRALILKRIVDVIGAGILTILTAPIILALAIAVKLDSPGPVFFRQERAGLGGRRFRMFKFRTMQDGADDEKADLAHLNRSGDVRLFKIADDPRVTRLGRHLRRWSIDELPQFWNVLIGDMSLVGPRPFFESDFDWYEDHHFRRLDAKPGITGLWQVSGRSELVNFEDVIYLDRQYIEQWSFWLDISILFRTIPAVLRRTGAY
jgi:exopolysaccharide biosynthesis polyprenyl glycosylphosphotransferase